LRIADCGDLPQSHRSHREAQGKDGGHPLLINSVSLRFCGKSPQSAIHGACSPLIHLFREKTESKFSARSLESWEIRLSNDHACSQRRRGSGRQKSYSELGMCKKWRKCECANIDNVVCTSLSPRGPKGCCSRGDLSGADFARASKREPPVKDWSGFSTVRMQAPSGGMK
jgi:hypothetical protein